MVGEQGSLNAVEVLREDIKAAVHLCEATVDVHEAFLNHRRKLVDGDCLAHCFTLADSRVASSRPALRLPTVTPFLNEMSVASFTNS